MEVTNKKEVTLYSVFLKYLITFCGLIFLSVSLIVFIFIGGMGIGVILPANYSQNNVEELKKEILNDEKFDKSKIEYPYSYGFYNKDSELIDSNFNKKQLYEVHEYLNGTSFNANYIYTKIELKDGICIIAYDIKPHFSSKYLNNIFPNLELLMFSLFCILFFIISVILVRSFGKKLRNELNPLKKSTESIMEQNLDFEVAPTNIKEFNEILNSIENMRDALKKSLETQWKSEQKKKEQISALAHDIKTPLTIIKGNAELLSECDSLYDDKKYVDFIIRNTDKIEKYTSLLMDISKAESDMDYTIESIDFDDFLQELIYETNMMCINKNIKSIVRVNSAPKDLKANRGLLMRALINIIINSIDYSNEGDKIEVLVDYDNSKLKFTIRDCGVGFTKEGLKNATSQFYMEESQRTAGKHYGIGLYIAETVAKKHNGEIVLKNREDRKGAEVSLILMCQ